MTELSFPTLRITAEALEPRGAFAEAQAAFLSPDPRLVAELDALLTQRKVGVVAHFYMDPELQGVLASCSWPHIRVSDSLLMADAAIEMVEGGVESIVVLGVDFMSENVRAMLDASGHSSVPVYRVVAGPIGCSLAESAEAPAYEAYLDEGATAEHALHVVYINTSLITKARAHAKLPTITCTSSNVVQTVLQAAAQVPEVQVFFGPDTYMGQNLAELFAGVAEMDDAAIASLHPAHDGASIARLLKRFRYFEQGTCIVHHMFGAEVVERVRAEHAEAFITAHLEVPGEMFALGLEAQRRGAGVVGSTSNILAFILEKTRAAIEASEPVTLSFVLGTEAGMITPIVRQVQAHLKSVAHSEVAVEVLFPVASEAIAQTGDAALPIVPGVAAGEGCTTAGGCATCPYMKMNSLDALIALSRRVGVEGDEALGAFHPRSYEERIDGHSAAELGGKSILHMRAFQRSGALSEALVAEIRGA